MTTPVQPQLLSLHGIFEQSAGDSLF